MMDIQSVFEDISEVKKKLSIEVSAQVVSEELNRIAQEFRKQVSVPGFRKGRAPFELVKKRFEKDIREEVTKRLIPESYHEVIRDKDIKPVRSPSIEELDFQEGKPLKYVAKFEVQPVFEVPDYKGLRVRLDIPQSPEELLEKRLRALREQHSTLTTIDNRAIDLGDYAVIDLHGRFVSEEGLPLVGLDPIDDENVVLEVGGDQTYEAFTRALLGLNSGDEKVFQVSYPSDYPEQKLAGQRVKFSVRVHQIKDKQVPALDDEFAKDVGNFENLKELKENLQEEILRYAETAKKDEIRNKIVEALINLRSFEVPEILVEEVLNNKLRDFAFKLVSQGVDIAKAGVDWPKIRSEFHPSAQKEVRAHFLLKEISRQEEIEISDSEIDEEIEKLARSSDQGLHKIKKHFAQKNRRLELIESLKQRKMIDLLVEKGIVEE